jgi:hypothetical protein
MACQLSIDTGLGSFGPVVVVIGTISELRCGWRPTIAA